MTDSRQSQSTSVSVPSTCGLKCTYCISFFTHGIKKITKKMIKVPTKVKRSLDYTSRYSDSLVLTARYGEPTENMTYLSELLQSNDKLPNKYIKIDIQTNGSLLLDRITLGSVEGSIIGHLKRLGVTTISLSLSSIFSDKENHLYGRPKKGYYVDIEKIAQAVKEAGLILRLSLNMTDLYNERSMDELFRRIKYLNADQVTFRKLYNTDNPQSENEKKMQTWIKEHPVRESFFNDLNDYIRKNGKLHAIMPFGALQYNVYGISCVIDDDCMDSKLYKAKDEKEFVARFKKRNTMKYYVIELDGRLYNNWNQELRII